MKLAELEAEKSKLVKKIQEKNLLKNCQDLALCGKYTKLKDRGHSTHGVWNYEDKEIKIKYEFGIKYYGDGEKLEVIDKETNNCVLYIVELEQRVSIKLKEGCFLSQYFPGNWEKKIKEKLTELPHTEVKPYKKNFPSMNLKES